MFNCFSINSKIRTNTQQKEKLVDIDTILWQLAVTVNKFQILACWCSPANTNCGDFIGIHYINSIKNQSRDWILKNPGISGLKNWPGFRDPGLKPNKQCCRGVKIKWFFLNSIVTITNVNRIGRHFYNIINMLLKIDNMIRKLKLMLAGINVCTLACVLCVTAFGMVWRYSSLLTECTVAVSYVVLRCYIFKNLNLLNLFSCL